VIAEVENLRENECVKRVFRSIYLQKQRTKSLLSCNKKIISSFKEKLSKFSKAVLGKQANKCISSYFLFINQTSYNQLSIGSNQISYILLEF